MSHLIDPDHQFNGAAAPPPLGEAGKLVGGGGGGGGGYFINLQVVGEAPSVLPTKGNPDMGTGAVKKHANTADCKANIDIDLFPTQK